MYYAAAAILLLWGYNVGWKGKIKLLRKRRSSSRFVPSKSEQFDSASCQHCKCLPPFVSIFLAASITTICHLWSEYLSDRCTTQSRWQEHCLRKRSWFPKWLDSPCLFSLDLPVNGGTWIFFIFRVTKLHATTFCSSFPLVPVSPGYYIESSECKL